jgi:hypothetical protein
MIRVTHKSEYLRAAADFNPPQSILTITYEGHVCRYPPFNGSSMTTIGSVLFDGIVASHFEHGTKSEQILVSYDLDPQNPGSRLAIGDPNTAQGTNRLVPQVRWVIVQNLTEDDYLAQVPIINTLIGTLNDDNWPDPTYNPSGVMPQIMFPRGMWLYLGPEVTQNRDGTYTLQHKFDYDGIIIPSSLFTTTTEGAGDILEIHRYLWYFLSEYKVPVGNIYKIQKRPTGDPQLSTIYLTAGSESIPGVVPGNVPYTFSMLFTLVAN